MTTKVSFQLPAEYAAHASEGILLGDFNNWNPEQAIPLQRTEDGSLIAELNLAAGKTYQYRYLLNDGRWLNDNNKTTWAELYGGYVENCVVEVPEAEEPSIEKRIPAPKTVVAKKTTVVKAKPLTDDLTIITGINKKVISLLKKHGFISFKDLSATTIKNLKTILETSGDTYSSINPTAWPKAAKLAATGKWEELKSLQAESKKSK